MIITVAPFFQSPPHGAPNDRAVDYQIPIGPVGGQRLEHPLPSAGLTPAAETPVHWLPLVVAPRKSAPPTGIRLQTSCHRRPSG